MDSIGVMLNPIGKIGNKELQNYITNKYNHYKITHYKKEFCNGFTGKS